MDYKEFCILKYNEIFQTEFVATNDEIPYRVLCNGVK